MSEIYFPDPQDYDAESFGQQSLPKIERKRGSNRSIWIVCGGCTFLLALGFACCFVGGIFAVRWDLGQASIWLSGFEQPNYDLAELIVCENSQAESLTNDLIAADAKLLNYTFRQESFNDTYVTGTMEIAGETTPWNAEFVISGGGTFGGGIFGRCINEIIVDS